MSHTVSILFNCEHMRARVIPVPIATILAKSMRFMYILFSNALLSSTVANVDICAKMWAENAYLQNIQSKVTLNGMCCNLHES